MKPIQRMALSLGIGLIVAYIAGIVMYSMFTYPNTEINGVDTSNMSRDKVSRKLSEEKEFCMSIGDNTYNVNTDAVDININEDPVYLWFINVFINHKGTCGYEISDAESQRILEEVKKDEHPSINASIKYENEEYVFQKGITGLHIDDEEKFKEIIKEAVINNNTEPDMSLFKITPANADSEESMEKAVITANEIISGEYCFQFDDVIIKLSKNEIAEMLDVSENGAKVNKEKAMEYINKIADQYDTVGKERVFKTSEGNDIILSATEEYGWKMDRDKTADNLVNALNSKTTGKVKMEFDQTAQKFTDKDYGDTYIEISLEKQHLWCYVNGELATEGDIVSGNPEKETATPVGIYAIRGKTGDITYQGEVYEMTIDVWITLTETLAMHDAPWLEKFGGDVYTIVGSEGNIYGSKDLMLNIRDNSYDGEAVIIY